MNITRSWAALLLLVVFTCACSNSNDSTTALLDSQAAVVPAEIVPAGLPALSELEKSTSMVDGIDGAAYSMGHGLTIEEGSVILEYTGTTFPASDRRDYAYAVYVFDEVQSLPPILEVRTHGENTSRVYPAIANWRTGRWDFGFGHIYTYSAHSFPLPQLEEQPGDFISPDNRVAIAFLKVDQDGPSWIDSLTFWEPEEVLGVVATEGLWDGIQIDWEVASGTDLVNIERRAQGVPLWEDILAEPIAANLITYNDTSAEGGIYYEYRVSGGFLWNTVLGPQYYWTTGKKAVGLRNVDTVGLGMNDEEYLVPGNSFNRLSFYFAPSNDANGVHAIRNTSFPPGQDWELYDETSTNFPYLNVVSHPDLGPGISVFHLNELNNPLVNIAYSDGTGTYAYAARLDQEGLYEWLDPGIVRQGQNHVMGTMELERRLACFTWNSQSQQVEMIESVDQEGTFWWDYNPDGTWAVVSEREPVGRMDVSATMRQSIAFREAITNDVVICKKGSEGWEEQTVGIETSADPVLQNIKISQLDNTGAVFYRDMDGKRIRLVRSHEGTGWLTNQQETLVHVKDEDQINEFVHYMLEPPSNFNVLAYTHNGDLKFKFSSKTGQDVWTEEFLIDDSGNCRNLEITRIGTDLQWAYFTFLSYIRNDEFGNPQLKFVDLNSMLEAEGMI